MMVEDPQYSVCTEPDTLQRGGYRWTILRSGKPQVRSETSYLTEDEADATGRLVLQGVGCLAQALSNMIGQTVERGSTSSPSLAAQAAALEPIVTGFVSTT
jgi:hypothetical protein